MEKSITIVTAFFDIGRGNWNEDNGRVKRLERTNDTYLSYFNNLAQLDNKIVVFTSPDLKERVLALRQGKPTHVIAIDIYHKFNYILKKISSIQNSDAFKKLIPPEQLHNPEYWSPEYVLVTNLKTYFVKKTIDLNLVHSELAAWIDFGYVRNKKTLYGIKKWYHPFEPEKVHFFSIRNTLNLKDEKAVMEKVHGNEAHIIGGVIIASKEKWYDFYKIVTNTQKRLLSSNIIDDDQGIFLICASREPNLFKLNYLGHMRWFRIFRLFHKGSKSNYFVRLGILLKIIK